MELLVISTAWVAVITALTAIHEALDWMPHYRREGEEDFQDRERYALTYDQHCDQGYRE